MYGSKLPIALRLRHHMRGAFQSRADKPGNPTAASNDERANQNGETHILKKFLVAVAIALTGVSAQAEDRWLSIPEVPAMPAAVESGMAEVNGIQMYYAT